MHLYNFGATWYISGSAGVRGGGVGRVEPWLWVGRGGVVFEVSEGGRRWFVLLSFVSGELYPQYPFGVYVDKSTVNHNHHKTPEMSNL